MSNIISIPSGELLDLAVENGMVPDNYFDLWNELASWQFDMLLKTGLSKDHYVLDIGCGAMRVGMSLVNYLKENRYFGIDAYKKYVDFAHMLMEKYCPNKNYNLIFDEKFNFEYFNVGFDFAIAQSVFTHLSNNQIIECIRNLKKVMKPKSRFVFTYLLNTQWTRGFLYDGFQLMERSLIENDEFFNNIANEYSLIFKRIEVVHPTNQLIGIYEF